MIDAVPQLPQQIYYLVGFVALTNLGAIGFIVRGVWWLAKVDSRLERVEKDIDFAFEKLRNKNQDTKE